MPDMAQRLAQRRAGQQHLMANAPMGGGGARDPLKSDPAVHGHMPVPCLGGSGQPAATAATEWHDRASALRAAAGSKHNGVSQAVPATPPDFLDMAAYRGPRPSRQGSTVASGPVMREAPARGWGPGVVDVSQSTRPAMRREPLPCGVEPPREVSEPRIVDITEAAAEPTDNVRGSTQPGFANPAEEAEYKRENAAARLVRAIGREAARVSQSDVSRLAVADKNIAHKALLATIVKLGGQGGAMTTTVALFLEEWTGFLVKMIQVEGEPPPQPFPIVVTDVVAYIEEMKLDADTTKAAFACIGKAIGFLDILGAEIIGNPALLASSAIRVPAGAKMASSAAGGKAREAPCPMYVLMLEKAAKEAQETSTTGFCSTPAQDYICHEVERLRFGGRGAGYFHARYLSQSDLIGPKTTIKGFEGVDVMICHVDKDGRADVLHFLPRLSLVFPGVCAWQGNFTEAFSSVGFMYIDWKPVDPKGKKVTDAAAYIAVTAPSQGAAGAPQFRAAAKKKALEAAQNATEMATGRSREQQMADGTSGTHYSRKLCGETTAMINWPGKQSDTLGDWRTPADPNDPSATRKVAARPKRKAVSTRVLAYQPKHTMREQIEARTRWALAMQKAYEVYGIDNVTWDTEWTDLFPADPPEALKPFYGEQSASSVPDLDEDNGAFAGTTYALAVPAPPSSGRGAKRALQ